MESWAEKYRPKNLSEIIGNTRTINELQKWASSWGGKMTKKGVILSGPPGCGKTSAAIALANDMGWEIIKDDGYGIYTWSNGAETEDISDLSAGTYSVVVTDENGCSVSIEVVITSPEGLEISSDSSDYTGYGVSCNGASDGSIR